jgi:DNA-binding winged helix-turn-helix (wHTH) protein
MASQDETITKQEEAGEIAPVIPAFPARYARFGEFQLDLQREELWKDGERVRLQGKIYQTLLLLLSRAGNVVTRDEVRRHLWPENSQVNIDANVNTSMNKLRQVLGDSPDKPTYIETIPRKGYGFVPAVQFADALQPFSPKPDAVRAVGESAESGTRDPKPTYSLPLGLRAATLLLAGMIVGALLALAWFSFRRSSKELDSTRTRQQTYHWTSPLGRTRSQI